MVLYKVVRSNVFNSFSTTDKGIALLYLQKASKTFFLKGVSLILCFFNKFNINIYCNIVALIMIIFIFAASLQRYINLII